MRRLAAAALGAFLLLGAGCSRQPRQVPEIIGEINNEYLTSDEFLHHFKARGGTALDKKARGRFKQTLLAELIDRKLLLQEAKRRRVSASRRDVRRRIDRISSRSPAEEDRERLEAVSDDLYDQEIIDRLLDSLVRGKRKISKEEIAAYIEANPRVFSGPDEVLLRQIVVHSASGVKKVRSELAAGAQFAQLAKERSEAPEAGTGGLLGWVGEADLPAELWEAVKEMKPGETKGGVPSPWGVHFFLVEDVREKGPRTGKEADSLARRRIEAQRRADAAKDLIERLRAAAVIKVDLKALEVL